MRIRVIPMSLVCATVAGAAPPVFTNVTTPEIADALGHSRGVSWADYDGDGDLDLYVTNWTGGPNRLHRNNGDGTFTWIQGGLLSDSSFGGGASWVDMDNDGDLDVFIANSGDNRLIRNDGNGVFSSINILFINDGGLSRSSAWGDVDGNGFVDLYFSVAGVTGASDSGKVNRLALNLAPNVLAIYPYDTLEMPTQVGRGVAWADFDDDGDLDLYVANGGPPDTVQKMPVDHSNGLFLNNGDGTFTDITPPELALADNSRSVTWADYDNDGDLDLFVTTVNVGTNDLFENTPEGFVRAFHPAIEANGRTRDASWGDYDNDGDLDLYLSSVDDNRLLENLGDGFVFIDVTDGALGNAANGRGVTWADYDDDGDLDLFNATSLENTLFRNDTVTGNHWLKVRLTGTTTNRSAVGARITIYVGETIQTREVNAGEGYLSCRPLEQHFGLGKATVIDRLEVRWPTSTITQVFENVPVDQTLHIEESLQITADLNGDGVVDGADLAALLAAWGSTSPTADITNNGIVDGADLAALLAAWGTTS